MSNRKTTMQKSLKLLAATAAGLALMTGASLAADARATSPVNIRSGPSTDYRVVDVLSRGERVNVETCRSNGWCFINHRGSDGWVSSRYLTADGGRTTPRRQTQSNSSAEFTLRFGGPDFSFSIGSGEQQRQRPPRRTHRPQVYVQQNIQQNNYYYGDVYNNDCYEYQGYTVCE